jgi:hypothetical protein
VLFRGVYFVYSLCTQVKLIRINVSFVDQEVIPYIFILALIRNKSFSLNAACRKLRYIHAHVDVQYPGKFRKHDDFTYIANAIHPFVKYAQSVSIVHC